MTTEGKILYYPTIIVPEQWLKTVVLYWDKVSSIVPHDFDFDNPPKFVSYNNQKHIKAMKLLEEYGIYEPTFPELPDSKLTKSFEEEFLNIIDINSFYKSQNYDHNSYKYSGFIEESSHTEEVHYADCACHFVSSPKEDGISEKWLLHRDKFFLSTKLYEILEKNNLIHRYDKSKWFITDKDIALTYMSLLAKYHQYYDWNIMPATDHNYYWEKIICREIAPHINYTSPSSSIEEIPTLNLVFDKVLPTPKENIPIGKILKFKEKREEELIKFREKVLEFINKLSNVENPEEMRMICFECSEEIRREISELKRCMRDENIEIKIDCGKSIMKIAVPLICLYFGEVKDFLEKFSLIPIDSISLSGIAYGIVKIPTMIIERRHKLKKEISKNPYAYLYYADKEKIIKL